jgi:hypothetical protein
LCRKIPAAKKVRFFLKLKSNNVQQRTQLEAAPQAKLNQGGIIFTFSIGENTPLLESLENNSVELIFRYHFV